MAILKSLFSSIKNNNDLNILIKWNTNIQISNLPYLYKLWIGYTIIFRYMNTNFLCSRLPVYCFKRKENANIKLVTNIGLTFKYISYTTMLFNNKIYLFKDKNDQKKTSLYFIKKKILVKRSNRRNFKKMARKFTFRNYYHRELFKLSSKFISANFIFNSINVTRKTFITKYSKKKRFKRFPIRKYTVIYTVLYRLPNFYFYKLNLKKRRNYYTKTKLRRKVVTNLTKLYRKNKKNTFNIVKSSIKYRNNLNINNEVILFLKYLYYNKDVLSINLFKVDFFLDSMLLSNYFLILMNNLVTMNFKYYRTTHPKGIQPQGFKLVDRKKSFLLRNFDLYDLYKIIILVFKTSDINLLRVWIKKAFESISFKKHKFLCYLLRLYLKRLFSVYKRYTPCTGFYLRIKGKISVGGNSRKRSFIVRIGKRSFTQKSIKLHYTDFFLFTETGILGVKFLFSYK